MTPDDPDEEEAEAPPPADSGAGMTQAIEADEQADIDQGEGKDRFGIA